MTAAGILRRAGRRFVVAAVLLICLEDPTMGATASRLDTSRYFDDADVAAFVDDLQNGRADRVAAGLKRGVDPNSPGREDFRPIFFIFPARTTDAASVLLDAGADPNARLPNGDPVLMLSVRMENPGFTELLLAKGADPNATGENAKPVIHEAVRAGVPEQLRLLAGAGADMDTVWGAGTPLTAAIAGLSWTSAATLLDLGVDTEWRKPTGRARTTAGEKLCGLFTRERPLRIPADLHGQVRTVFEAFARRGVQLPCAEVAERFR